MLKNPSQDTQVSVTSLWQRTRKTQDGPEEAGTQQLSTSQQYTRCFPAPRLMSTAKHVQALSPATSRKVKSMSTPGGIKFDPDCNLFHEACRNLGASQLWMLDKASVWSAYSGKHSHAQQNIFSLSSLTMDFMDQRIRHLFEEMIPEGEGIALGEGYFPQNAT